MNLKPGSRIVYNDGRGDAFATVLEVNDRGCTAQFDDRARSTYMAWNERAWWDHIKLA